jgi:SgrR family transcriptional regulator
MKLGKHYIRLREHFSESGTEVSVTVEELSDILDCTHRNVLLLLNRMSEVNWLQWNPKSGRGNRSKLVFLVPTEQLILELAKSLVEQKDLRGALEQMNVPSIPPTMKENFNNWLYRYFGYRTEVKDHRKIDTLRFPLSGPLLTLDPVYTNFASESHLVRQMFDSLVRYNTLTQNIQPHLAHFWEVDNDRTRWTFYLRKGVLFHHGREMTADDVFYSLNRPRHLQERSLYRWVYMQIKQIEVIDPTTIQVELFQPNELFLLFLSTNRAAIVPKDACEESAERFGKSPLGTGPFKLVRNDRSMCVLEAFPHYYQGRAHLDRVEIWNIPDLYEQEHQNPLESFQIIHNAKEADKKSISLNQVKEAGTTCKFKQQIIPSLTRDRRCS